MNQIKSKVIMDLMQRSSQAPIDVVQDDRYVRSLEITLTSGGDPWEIPADASVLVRYQKFDGTGGEYDTLPDGTAAWSAAGNVLTVALAPMVLSKSGPVSLWVTLVQLEQQISTFSILLNVSALAECAQSGSGEYMNTTGFLPAPVSGAVGQYLRVRCVNDKGQVTEVETVAPGTEAVLHSAQALTAEQQAQARSNIAAVALPAAAAVGQTIVVLAVDEKGVPTQWEAADLPVYEEWTFTLQSGTKVTKKVAVGA